MNPTDILDDLIREMDAIQSKPFRVRLHRKPINQVPARSTVSSWIDQFVNLLVIR